jgi:hypothetical protein
MTRRLLIQALIFVAVVALAPHGRGDLPPPSDKKFVDYAFRVDNAKAFPDYVVLAFPWSLSNGAPTKEHALVEDGKPVSVGRRSSVPELYAMKRSEYESWKEEYKPTMEHQDPALDALFASQKVVRCTAKLSPEFLLAKNDPRSQVLEAFRVEAIDATSCRLAKVGAAENPKSNTPASTSAPDPTRTESAPTPAATRARGCGGCATARANDSSFLIWASLAVVALLRRPFGRGSSRSLVRGPLSARRGA